MNNRNQNPPILRQPPVGSQLRRTGTPWSDPEFVSSYPTLFAYMTQETWEDGTPRQTATLTLYVDGSALTVIINDRHNVRSAFVNEASLFSALLKIEAGLVDNTLEWRAKKDSRSYAESKIPF